MLYINVILEIEMIKTQTISSGPSAAMEKKKQCGPFFGLQPGGSNKQDLVCPHPWEENWKGNMEKTLGSLN